MPKETVIPKDFAAAVKDIKLAILQARAKTAHLVRQMPSAEIRPMPYDFRVILKRPVTEPNVEKTMVKTRVETRAEEGKKSSLKRPMKKMSSAQKIMTYLAANPTATTHELSIVINLTVKGVEWNLKALTESGRLRHVGPSKGGHWEVIG